MPGSGNADTGHVEPLLRAMYSHLRLAGSLANLGIDVRSARLCVAFSGGVDSSVLLHSLASLRSAHPELGLRAIHVNHHLHERAGEWQESAIRFASGLSVRLTVAQVEVTAARGESVEAAARDARYRVLEDALSAGEYLLTAHHCDDQLETVLLQLLRGAGAAGLAAMPRVAPFGAGWHARPLLEFDRAELAAYATANGIAWSDDPSNANARFDRSYLRHAVLPLLRARWPAAAASAARSATHLAEAQGLLEHLAAADLANAIDGRTLRISALRELPIDRRRNAVRHWIRIGAHAPPSTARLQQILEQMFEAGASRSPVIRWEKTEVRRYRDRLYVGAVFEAGRGEIDAWDWQVSAELDLGPGLGQLRLAPAGEPGLPVGDLPNPLRVGWRHGTVRLRPEKNRPSRTLKQLFQEAGVVPWMRDRVPLLFAAKALVAVGDLWLDANFQPPPGSARHALQWRARPELF